MARSSLKLLPKFIIFSLVIMLTVQCRAAGNLPEPPTPPLPAPPGGPVLRVALLIPASGEMATLGRMLRNGLIMAFDEWNNRGGVLGRRLDWVEYDPGCDFETGQRAAQQALTEGARFIIGPLCSEGAIAAAPLAEANQALLMAPAATHPLVTLTGQGQIRSTVFRASFAFPWQGQAAARFALDHLQTRRAALLFDPHDDYSTGLTDAFARQFTAEGGQIVRRATYPSSDQDFGPTLAAIRQAGAQIIYLPAPVEVVNRVAGQLGRPDSSPPVFLLGSDTWDSPNLDLAAVSGGYFTPHFFLEDNNPAARQWAEAYKATYAIEPTPLAALGYEAASLLAAAIQRAGTLEVNRVAQTLEQGRFNVIGGEIAFDSQHNPLKPVPVIQIKEGRRSFVTAITP